MTFDSFHGCLIVFYKKCVFYNEWIKPNETKHFSYLFTCRVQHCIISAFTVLDVFGLSRGQRLHKLISAESKLPLPDPSNLKPLTFLISTQLLLNSHHACQMRLRTGDRTCQPLDMDSGTSRAGESQGTWSGNLKVSQEREQASENFWRDVKIIKLFLSSHYFSKMFPGCE